MKSSNHFSNFLVLALLAAFILPSVSFAAGGICVQPSGDINGDNIVDNNDLEIMALNWLVTPCDESNAFCDGADLNDSNNVDFIDYALLAADWQVAGNCSPVVIAGPNQVLTLPVVDANLDGTVTDDGLPNPPAAVTTLWTVVSGPNDVIFGDANQVDTTANFGGPGVYVLRLTADDSQASTSDDITIIVNQGPVVDAGIDQTITYQYPNPTNAILDGTVTDDNLPSPVTTLWTQQSGTGTVTFADASAIDTTATFPDAGGVFVLRLTADDGAATTYDEVTVTVVGKPAWSESADYYVDGLTGSDTNAGNSNQPWKTITKAASTLNGTAAKDKVLVWGGGGGGRPATQAYVGQVMPSNSGSASNPNTFRRDPASGEAIVDANGNNFGAIYINARGYQTFDGFSVINSNGGWYGVYLLGDLADNVTIKNCRIRNAARYGIYDKEGDNLTINNCAIYNVNTTGGSYADISIAGSTGTVTGCQITSCSIYGGGNTSGKYGIQAINTATIDSIKNCIITNHKMGGSYGILKDTGLVVITSISYCDIWNNGTNYSTGLTPTNSISSDPKFVDPANGNFQLGAGSPCIGTGESGINMGYRLLDTAL